MPAAAHKKKPASRDRLLAAGRRLAASTPLAELTGDRICQEAGLKPTTFVRQFRTPTGFHVELMELLFDEVRDSIAKLTYNMPAGLPRMKLAIETFLAASLARPALREMSIALRADRAGAEVVRRRVLGFMMMMELELKSVGWPRPVPTARLLTAAVIEAAQAEFEAGRALPPFRKTLFDYLDSHLA